jgi:bifunctional non-homologous end joining protein LigD
VCQINRLSRTLRRNGDAWIHEIKHEGFRLLARRDAAGVRLFTRRGIDWTDRYPSIATAVAAPMDYSLV